MLRARVNLGIVLGILLFAAYPAVAAPGGAIRLSVESGDVPRACLSVRASGPAEQICSLQQSVDLTTWWTLQFTNTASGSAGFLLPLGPLGAFFRVAFVKAGGVIRPTNYHGWADALVLSNHSVEVVVVPTVGRILQFRFLGDEIGTFWENYALDGAVPDPKSTAWLNFGGDKVWPAPQADWPLVTGRSWPPPSGFDATAFTATAEGTVMTLTSEVDSNYGLRITRRIQLHPAEPMLCVSTTFEKAIKGSGRTNGVSVWTITQLQSPQRVYVPVPGETIFPRGYTLLSSSLPAGWTNQNSLISFSRDTLTSHKIGTDASTLVWIGSNACLRIDSPRCPEGTSERYPDNGSSVEVYTNPNPDAYVELEMLGPIRTLGIDETSEQTVFYRLFPRSSPSPEAEAARLLGY